MRRTNAPVMFAILQFLLHKTYAIARGVADGALKADWTSCWRIHDSVQVYSVCHM